jgi:hypothetical protein
MVTHSHASGPEERPAAVVKPDTARSAVKSGVVRYVLAISLAGAIVGMFIAWLYFGW